eukprot:976303_1
MLILPNDINEFFEDSERVRDPDDVLNYVSFCHGVDGSTAALTIIRTLKMAVRTLSWDNVEQKRTLQKFVTGRALERVVAVMAGAEDESESEEEEEDDENEIEIAALPKRRKIEYEHPTTFSDLSGEITRRILSFLQFRQIVLFKRVSSPSVQNVRDLFRSTTVLSLRGSMLHQGVLIDCSKMVRFFNTMQEKFVDHVLRGDFPQLQVLKSSPFDAFSDLKALLEHLPKLEYIAFEFSAQDMCELDTPLQ